MHSETGSPLSLLKSVRKNDNLIVQLTRRDIIGRYKGSVFGLAWSFVTPLLMLGVYTFVFSVVFKVRWQLQESQSDTQFAVILFSGLIIHGILAEILMASPLLITSNVNYVKKVVFPLEVLSIVAVNTSLINALAAFSVLVTALAYFTGSLNWTIFIAPFVLAPLVLLLLGISWFLATLGVYIRDISHVTGLLSTILLFLSPIFFPVESLPDAYQPLILLNPLSFIIQEFREVVIWGRYPDWVGLAKYSLVSILVLLIGFYTFQKTRKGFADVL